MANEQINVDLTATDKASKPIDKVADKAETLEKLDPEVQVTADDDATKQLKRIEDTAKAIEKQDWIVRVRADIDKAKAQAAELRDKLQDLERDETKVEVTADTSQAEKRFKDLQESRPGKAMGESFVRDVGGAFGGSAFTNLAADLSAAFETAGEAAGSTGAGAVISSMSSKIVPALAVAGVVGSAVVGLWKLFADDSKKASDEAVKNIRAAIIQMGKDKAVGKALEDVFAKAPNLAAIANAGILSWEDLTSFIQGRSTPAMAAFVAQQAKASDVARTHAGRNAEVRTEGQKMLDVLDDAAEVFRISNRQAADFASIVGRQIVPGMRDLTGTSRDAQGAVVSVAQALHDVPGDTKANVNVTDNGTAAATKGRIDAIPTRKNVDVSVQLTGQINDPRMAFLASQPRSVTNVTINAPAGVRAGDLVRAGERYARRNGGTAVRARR